MLRLCLRLVPGFLFLALTVSIQAQRPPRQTALPVQVHGQVRYSEGGRPAEIILVRLELFGGGIAGEAITDRTGRFSFTNLNPELYIVSVRLQGFQEIRQEVDLRTQPTDYVQLQLVAEKDSVYSPSTKATGVIDVSVPNQARVEFERGRDLLLQVHSTDEAIAHLENAVKIYPNYSEAMLLLGTAYMDRSEWDKAEVTLKRFCELAPKIAAARFALGELYLRQKNYSDGEKYALEGLALDSQSVGGHFLLARIYYERGDIIKAGPQVGTALQLNPKFAEGHLLAGNILLRARQPENALAEFDEYLRLAPNGNFSEQTKETVQRIQQALAKH